MAVHEKNRFVRTFHAVVAILMLLAGGALLGTGIWLLATDNAGPLDLEYADNNVWDFVLNFGIGGIIIGGFLMIAAITGLVALSRKCVGSCFKVVYIVMALVVLAVLLLITVASAVIRARGDSQEVKDFLEEAWDRTVKENPDEICRLEEFYECRGFDDTDCSKCRLGIEAECSATVACANCGVATNVGTGCYDEIVDSVRKYFLPVAVVGGVLSAIVIIDILMTCAL